MASNLEQNPYMLLKRALINNHLQQISSQLSSLLPNSSVHSKSASNLSPSSFDINNHDYDILDANLQRTLLFSSQSADAVQLLLHAGAIASARDKYGRTFLHVAAERQQLDIVCVLVSHDPSLIHLTDSVGNIALFDATSPSLVEYLLSSGADINHANNQGNTILHKACTSGRVELLQLLLQHGGNAHQRNSDGRLGLHIAAEYGHTNVVRALLLSDAVKPPLDVNSVDHAGWSALHFACLGGFPEHESHTPIVDILLQKGCSATRADHCGLTPLHVCTDTTAMRLLLAQPGVDVNACDEDGRTALHLLGSHSCAVLLGEDPLPLPYVFDIHKRDRWGRTALHLSSDADKTKLLVLKGVEIDAIDDEGKTALDWAIETQRPDVSQVLIKLGAHRSSELPPPPLPPPASQLTGNQCSCSHSHCCNSAAENSSSTVRGLFSLCAIM